MLLVLAVVVVFVVILADQLQPLIVISKRTAQGDYYPETIYVKQLNLIYTPF